jgi:uncharacterized caspase-like protein
MQNKVQMFARLFTFIIALGFASIAAIAETPKTQRGVALVIGQSAYKNLSPLTNPANDAREMEKALRNLGFETTVLTDLTAKKLRRDLENFVVDAEGADVAVVYYSGHGIEAGGENWLVPIDADISAPESAAGKLVALSPLLSSLKLSVPITLLFLDACRSNPFPAGMQLIKEGKPVPISASGLVLTRGAGSEEEAHAKEGYGTVIGFAAEPGRPALDGEPGGNSPYAAALLRHLQAMNGEEFGVVMRMVTQEVYLKTKGQQRPWTNESLAKLLYFGAKPQDLSGDEGQILGERRKLLLTIDGLGEDQRKQVEQAAKSGGVPMDALFGLLRTLGAETPKDPKELDKILAAQTEKLKIVLADRKALTSLDPELARLSGLADQALADGALDANLKFREEAKTHFAKVALRLDDTEANLKARRMEGAEIFAKTAEAYDLKADFLPAAENYAKAFEQVEKWDREKAWRYKLEQGGSLQAHGSNAADNSALLAAIDAYRVALTFTNANATNDNWATTQNKLGFTLSELGERETSTDRLQESLTVLAASIKKRPRATMPQLWGETQNEYANTLTYLGRREGNIVMLQQAANIHRELAQHWDRALEPTNWGNAQHNLSNVLLSINDLEPNLKTMQEALVAINASLEIWPKDEFGYDYALSQINRAAVLLELGELIDAKKNYKKLY